MRKGENNAHDEQTLCRRTRALLSRRDRRTNAAILSGTRSAKRTETLWKETLAPAPEWKVQLLVPYLLMSNDSAADDIAHLLMSNGSAGDAIQEGHSVAPLVVAVQHILMKEHVLGDSHARLRTPYNEFVAHLHPTFSQTGEGVLQRELDFIRDWLHLTHSRTARLFPRVWRSPVAAYSAVRRSAPCCWCADTVGVQIDLCAGQRGSEKVATCSFASPPGAAWLVPVCLLGNHG